MPGLESGGFPVHRSVIQGSLPRVSCRTGAPLMEKSRCRRSLPDGGHAYSSNGFCQRSDVFGLRLVRYADISVEDEAAVLPHDLDELAAVGLDLRGRRRS